MRKFLTCLVAGGLVLYGAASAEDFNLPERFRGYRQKHFSYRLLSGFVGMNNASFPTSNYFYFLRKGSSKPDVIESFLFGYDNPFFYWFDLDGNGRISYDESFFDFKMDGWNGNETRIGVEEKEEKKRDPYYEKKESDSLIG